jgi:hypothetical protein
VGFKAAHQKVGGRKKGTPNKATVEIKEFARSILEDPLYQKRLRGRVMQGKASQIEVLLFHYAYGKPKEHFAVERSFTLEELVTGSVRTAEDRAQPETLHTELGERIGRR